MWPLDRFKTEEVLRVGRDACERWKTVDRVLARVSVQALRPDTPLGTQPWSEAISALYLAPPDTSVTLVLESAWVPVVFIDMGTLLLRSNELEALVRHRFGLHQSSSTGPVAGWELRVEHRAGSRCALAFAMPPKLKQALIDAGRTAGVDWAAMTPALAWGLERLRIGRQWSRTVKWFIWPEQDRALVARIASAQVVGLNPGAAPADDEASLRRLVDAERARLGIASATDPIGAARWTSTPRPARTDDNFTWVEIGGQPGPLTRFGGSAPHARLSA